MRWIRFDQGRTAYGILEGDRIAEVAGDLFAGWERPPAATTSLPSRSRSPVVPPTFIASASTTPSTSARWRPSRASRPTCRPSPTWAIAPSTPLIAHDEPVVIPRDASKVQYEGELAVVIGKQAKGLSEAEALSCVLGYSIGNDVSERVWQKSDRTLWRAKNTDTFKPMGPWIETDVDLDALETIVRLNGKETLRFRTDAMIFGVAAYIAAITRYVTLHPGDILWTGTDGTSPDLKAGDLVEVEITGIGVLRNPFVAAP